MSVEPDYGEARQIADEDEFADWCRDNGRDPDDEQAYTEFVDNRPCRCCP